MLAQSGAYPSKENPACADIVPEETWSYACGCRTRYLRVALRAQKSPVLLVHGLLGYSFSWRFNIPVLARNRTVYAVDLPGVGWSERRKEQDCSLRGMAKGLASFLREQEAGPVDLVGTSHGGGLAIVLAALGESEPGWPRVRRLVLTAPVNPWSKHGRLLTRVLGSRPGGALFRCMRPAFKPIRGGLLRRLYGDPSRIAPGTLEGYAAPLNIEGTVEHLLDIMKCWRGDLVDIERALPAIAQIPTLLVWGSRDRAVLPQSALYLKSQFRHAELAVLDGAGHLPYEELPEEFNRVVMEFLDR